MRSPPKNKFRQVTAQKLERNKLKVHLYIREKKKEEKKTLNHFIQTKKNFTVTFVEQSRKFTNKILISFTYFFHIILFLE